MSDPAPPPAANPATKPAAWTADHDAFVCACAANNEDAKTILLLLEAEFPALKGASEAWVKGRMG
jgi:hypothetical protein